MPSLKCNICTNKIIKHKPSLICNLCNTISHHACNKLSKSDAIYIIENSHTWSCITCNTDLFPIGLAPPTPKPHNKSKPRVPCAACTKCLGPRQANCSYCERACHTRCIKGELGCTNCASEIIPGYYFSNIALIGTEHAQFSDKIYNPFENLNIQENTHTPDNDYAEADYWQEASDHLQQCNYRQHKSISTSNKSELKIMSLNVRSLPKHITEIRDDINEYTKFDILSFTETSCNPENSPGGARDFELPGFHPPTLQIPARTSCKGGGLAIYVNENLCSHDDFHVLDPLSSNNAPSNGEFLFINIKLRKNINRVCIIGTTYRSPSATPANYLETFKTKLQLLDRHKNKPIVIAGDTNIDLLQFETNSDAQNISDTAFSHGFVQMISRPTRITEHSATLIDHIYINTLSTISSTGVLINDISDHLGTYVNFNFGRNFIINDKNCNSQTRPCRKFSKENTERFTKLIDDESWDSTRQEQNTQSKYDNFTDTFAKHYNTAFPENTNASTKRKNQRRNPKPWILHWLEDATNRKNKLYHEFIKSPTTANRIKYNKMKKFVTKHIKLAKNKYYTKYFNDHHTNCKKQWNMLNSLINRDRKKSKPIKLTLSDGTVVSSPSAVANTFNDYFCNIASNLKTQIITSNHNDYRSTLGSPLTNTIYLHDVDSSEIIEHIKNLKNKSTSDTKIEPLKTLVNCNKFINTFVDVINASIKEGVFPSQLKMADVVPIYKSGTKTEVSNYRPISLLPTFSKIFEKTIHHRISDFLHKHNILHPLQFGFRKLHSCEHALTAAKNEILHTLDKKHIALLLLIDFSKAFDMVDHNILLHKLSHYGIRGPALDWLRSYLNERKQRVRVNNIYSDTKYLTHGIPQGSILGPLLFIIYINDMPNIQKLVKFILYADDANIIITGSNAHEVISKYNEISKLLTDWVASNGLLLNVKKTNYMIFSNVNTEQLDNFQPKMLHKPIERKQTAKFLGVHIDEKLHWTHHIDTLCTKMSRNIGILYKVKNILPQKAMQILFHSFIQSHLNHCSLIWGLGTKNSLKKLFVCQKKAIRTLIPGYVNYYYNKNTDQPPTHTKETFTKLNIMTIHSLILKNLLIFMNKIHNFPHLMPQPILALFTSHHPDTDNPRATISSRLTSVVNSIIIKGPRLYNEITEEAAEANSPFLTDTINRYKNTVKSYLLAMQSKDSRIECYDNTEWSPENFRLCITKPTRQSPRLNQTDTVSQNQFYSSPMKF